MAAGQVSSVLQSLFFPITQLGDLMNAWAKILSRILIALMIWTPYQIATAGMIGTDQVVASTSQADRTTVLNFLSRANVAGQLHSLGIDPATANDRVAAMSDQEVQ